MTIGVGLARDAGGQQRMPRIGCGWSAAIPTAVIALATPATQALITQAIGELHQGRLIAQSVNGPMHASRAWAYAALVVGIVCIRGVLQVLANWRWALFSAALGELSAGVLRAALGGTAPLGIGGGLVPAFEHWSDGQLATRRLLAEVPFMILAALMLIVWFAPLLGLVTAMIWSGATCLCLHAYQHLRMAPDLGTEFQHRWRDFLRDEALGARSVRGLRLEQARCVGLTGLLAEWSVARQVQRRISAGSSLPLHILLAAGQTLTALVGILLIAHDELDLTGFIAALVLGTSVAIRLEQVPAMLVPIVAGQHAAGRLGYQPAVAIIHPTAEVPRVAPALRLRSHETESPSGSEAELFTLRPGELVAVVGRTGDGKEAVAAAWSGRTHGTRSHGVFGSDLHGWNPLATLTAIERARAVQTVGCESRLLAGSIAANLRLGKPGLSDGDLHRALVRAGVEDAVAALPGGLQYDPGELGVALSGGQRQRLCLARAFAAQPCFLCLDEATCELDPDHERRVLAGLRSLVSEDGSGVLVVTSSPLLMAGCDRILVIARGRLVAHGSDAQLRRDCPQYVGLLGEELQTSATYHAPAFRRPA